MRDDKTDSKKKSSGEACARDQGQIVLWLARFRAAADVILNQNRLLQTDGPTDWGQTGQRVVRSRVAVRMVN